MGRSRPLVERYLNYISLCMYVCLPTLCLWNTHTHTMTFTSTMTSYYCQSPCLVSVSLTPIQWHLLPPGKPCRHDDLLMLWWSGNTVRLGQCFLESRRPCDHSSEITVGATQHWSGNIKVTWSRVKVPHLYCNLWKCILLLLLILLWSLSQHALGHSPVVEEVLR